MYFCRCCKTLFDEPNYEQFCFEIENGVASLFSTYNYGTRALCPECGSESVDYCDDDCELCSNRDICPDANTEEEEEDAEE